MHIYVFFFFFNDPAPTEIYPLSLHDALPIPRQRVAARDVRHFSLDDARLCSGCSRRSASECRERSEEHTSELQSQSNLVCRLLLEKKKNRTNAQLVATHTSNQPTRHTSHARL